MYGPLARLSLQSAAAQIGGYLRADAHRQESLSVMQQ
jgi:hypothetical protein